MAIIGGGTLRKKDAFMNQNRHNGASIKISQKELKEGFCLDQIGQ